MNALPNPFNTQSAHSLFDSIADLAGHTPVDAGLVHTGYKTEFSPSQLAAINIDGPLTDDSVAPDYVSAELDIYSTTADVDARAEHVARMVIIREGVAVTYSLHREGSEIMFASVLIDPVEVGTDGEAIALGYEFEPASDLESLAPGTPEASQALQFNDRKDGLIDDIVLFTPDEQFALLPLARLLRTAPPDDPGYYDDIY